MSINTRHQTILVTGATGKQGGAAVRHLIAKGFRVRALSRDPSKPAARELAELGIDVIQGDLDDRRSLDRAINGVHGAFSVGSFWEHGPEGEVRQGKAVADAAKAAGLKHLIYTSVDGAERATGLDHFESKWKVEQHIAEIGVPATILRPVFFMENFLTAVRPTLEGDKLTLALPMKPEKSLQLVAVSDIGAIAAIAFERPDAYVGKAIGIAGDELSMPQVAAAMQRFLGRTVEFNEIPLDAARSASRDMGDMFAWLNERGYTVDIPALREIFPALLRFDTWLHEVAFSGGTPPLST
jgi:uncharacterized protein YbjT (DUF2867 family)